MAEGSDAFDCRVPHLYESLALIDQIAEGDRADEFFDVAATPPKADGVQNEEFFTPLPIPNAPVSARTFLSPVVEELDDAEEAGSRDSCDRRKSGSDLPLGRVILKARRRSWQIPKKTEEKRDLEKLAFQMFEGIRLEPPTPEKTHSMMTRQDVAVKTPTLSLRNRKVVRNSLKRTRIQSPTTKGPVVKFMALAEQVHHFFNDTPPRFRRSSRKMNRPEENRDKERAMKQSLTVPHSPQLLTRDRARSPSPVPEGSHLIKALPLNPRVFQPPDLSCKPQPKPATVPEPFNLTVVQKKEVKLSAESTDLIQFKARPMPRSCRGSMSSLSSIPSTTTSVRRVAVCEKSDGTLEENEESSHYGVSHLGTSNRRQLKVQPFSFDLRDRMALQKKERKIQMLLEEAAKIPKFTARPVPSFIAHHASANDSSIPSASTSTAGTSRKSILHNHVNTGAVPKQQFKAKPASVLGKEPFKPKKAEAPLTDITEFELNTERRAKERAELEKARHEKEKERLKQMEKITKEQEDLEKKRIKELRRSMMPRPTPKPGFLGSDKH